MIQLVDRGLDDSIIRFTPRHAYRKLGPIECDLVHGHFCPWCNNVIQALYYTDKPIDLSKHEETRVISQGEKNEGELLKIVPNWEDDGNYKVQTFRTPQGNAQKIVLKNHVINWAGTAAGNSDNFFEVGERCCIYTCLIPLTEETAMREFSMVAGFSLTVGNRYEQVEPPMAFVAEWFKNANTWDTKETRTLPAIGRSPLAFLMKRKALKDQFQYVASKLYQAWDTRAEEEKVARELQVQSAGALAEFLDAPDESRL